MHWTKTPEGRKKLSAAQTARWAKRNGDGHAKSTIVSVEYQTADGKVEKVWLRRKTDPRPNNLAKAIGA